MAEPPTVPYSWHNSGQGPRNCAWISSSFSCPCKSIRSLPAIMCLSPSKATKLSSLVSCSPSLRSTLPRLPTCHLDISQPSMFPHTQLIFNNLLDSWIETASSSQPIQYCLTFDERPAPFVSSKLLYVVLIMRIQRGLLGSTRPSTPLSSPMTRHLLAKPRISKGSQDLDQKNSPGISETTLLITAVLVWNKIQAQGQVNRMTSSSSLGLMGMDILSGLVKIKVNHICFYLLCSIKGI